MPDAYRFAAKSHLGRDLTTSERKMVSGLSLVRAQFTHGFKLTHNTPSAWLNILAAANKDSPGKPIGINEILLDHYKKYGRSFFSRYDYEEVSSDSAQKLVDELNKHIADQTLLNTKHESSTGEFTVSATSNFHYTDPIDGSVSKNQGQIVQFSDGSRVVFRLSGTGSQGATVRLYVERYTKDATQFSKETSEGLKGLIEVALRISRLTEFLGREKPTVITVSIHHRIFSRFR